MNKIVSLILIVSFTVCAEESPVKYNKNNDKIYAVIDGNKITLPFHSDFHGNPSTVLGMFNGTPSLEMSARSIHDYTVYATIIYSGGLFNIDCMYYDLKSKTNGLGIKYGECGLGAPVNDDVNDYIENKVDENFSKLDSIDTSSLLTGKIDYISIILDRKKDKYTYKVYKNKEDLINGEYFLVTLSRPGMCTLHKNNTWLISNKGSVALKNEIHNKGGVLLENEGAVNGDSNTELCAKYLPFRVASERSYFYDEQFSKKKSYIVKGDYFNLQRVDESGKWCNVSYFNESGKAVAGNLLCSTLALK